MAYDVDDAGGRAPRGSGGRGSARGIRGLLTVPLAVVSAVAVTLGIAQPAEAAPQPVKRQPKAKASTAGATTHAASAAAGAVPEEVVVVEGDTVSGIAERFGLSTAEVLAHNGLGWSSMIFPGQRLALPGSRTAQAAPPARDAIAKHVVAQGDTMSGIAERYGVALDELLRVNGLGRQSLIFPGEAIVLPPDAAAHPAPAPAPVAAAGPDEATGPSPSDTHLVVDGDTVWDIAARNDVEVAELIAANGLDANATIRPGQRLTIPRPVAVATVASVSVVLTEEMRANAQLIVDVGRELGVPDSGIVVALAAAAQESGLKNVRHGDRDSQGLFQQRPSQGWGSVEQVLDPVRAATAFYGGPSNPNPGVTAGLLDIPGWESMSLTEAAQSVQQSAHPDHYAKWEAQARAWLAELG
ncbi:LysM peptidoglycan-binding domain-containing protein [Agromyces lapidis]|uniref:LysM peptidoglycan-binding domain-containing protein n=1 Tax=Agromyces lapidis TaxID=279574 RepID=A0ABV5SYC6_9MICO|nr:LysM peptidoglycan-binding domain-containing protein [Agromyces lapidis]